MKSLFLRNPSKPLFWLILGLIFKGIIPFIWLLHSKLPDEIPGFFGGTGGDTSSYIDPIDNWLAHGVYRPDFRMPGYGLVYLIFRILFSKAIACDILILLQYLLASVSVYYLALTARNTFNSNKMFYVCFYLFLISNYPNFFDGFIQTESLCTSFLIFSVYFFTKYFYTNTILYLFLSSVLLTWAVFMRPGFALLVPLFALFVVFQPQTSVRSGTGGLKGALNRSDIGKNIIYAIIFLIPFMLLDSIWTIRNYGRFKKIIPLAVIGNYPNISSTYLQPMFCFAECWGGAYSLSSKEPDMSWFDYTYPGGFKPPHYDSLPDYIYTSQYNKDSLLHLKKLIQALQNPLIDSASATAYQKELIAKFNKYRVSFQKEKPFLYFIKVPLKLTAILLYGPFTKKYLNRGQTLGVLNPILSVVAAFLYLAVLVLGLAGMIMLLFTGFKQNILFLFIALIPLYTIFIHAVVLRVPDNRFIMPAWSFLILCASYLISKVYDKYMH